MLRIFLVVSSSIVHLTRGGIDPDHQAFLAKEGIECGTEGKRIDSATTARMINGREQIHTYPWMIKIGHTQRHTAFHPVDNVQILKHSNIPSDNVNTKLFL